MAALPFVRAAPTAVSSCVEFRFASFKLPVGARLLLQDGRPVPIGARAMDLLLALVERAGQVVSKQELVSRVWPAGGVEECSLRFHIATLRRLLGDGRGPARFITNVSGRGYAFVAEVQRTEQPQAARDPGAPRQHPSMPNTLPAGLTRMLGRDALLDRLARLAPERRLIAITGPAGMGKSTLALALAERLLEGFAGGVGHVDLSVHPDAGGIEDAIASAFGCTPAAAPLTDLLRHRRLLLVLDNAEHLAGPTRDLAARLMASLPELHLIITSRQRWRPAGDVEVRLGPLDAAAVQLFVERAAASMAGFQLMGTDAETVAQLCRALDGMPLAIELAAAHVAAFGVQGLLDQVQASLPLHVQGRRGGPQRHGSLKHLLDWSYLRLEPGAQRLLRDAARFHGSFTRRQLAALTGCTARQHDLDALAGESLIQVDASRAEPLYHLLRTTRMYALHQTEAAAPHSQLLTRPS